MTERAAADPIRAIATLSDDVRRRLYEFLRVARRPVSRDEAAEAVGVSRKLAAFHLDKLVDAGLLRTVSMAAGIRRVGRPPKVYEPNDADLHVSIPARRHEVLAEILVQAVAGEQHDGSVKAAAMRAAYQRGLAAGAGGTQRGRLSADEAMASAERMLAEYGFEPYRCDAACIRLSNCPFHPLAQQEPRLVCGLNHAFILGMLSGSHADALDAVLAPSAGECCVELRAMARHT